jgi:hypothetical protein
LICCRLGLQDNAEHCFYGLVMPESFLYIEMPFWISGTCIPLCDYIANKATQRRGPPDTPL